MDKDEDRNRRERDDRRFSFDTTVNIAHIITTLGLIAAVMVWGLDMKALVLKHESEITEIKQSRRDNQIFLRGELQELNRKLDRVAERVGADK